MNFHIPLQDVAVYGFVFGLFSVMGAWFARQCAKSFAFQCIGLFLLAMVGGVALLGAVGYAGMLLVH